MDNQGMGMHNEPFFELLQPTTPPIATGSSSGSYVQNGPRRMDSSNFTFNSDDVLPNYDFQAVRSNGHGSSSSTGAVRIDDAAGGNKYRQATPSFEPQVRDPPVTYEKYESTRSRHEFDKDAYDSATAATVERIMKKYADNLLRVLEGIGGRLSQLEANTQRLEHSFDKVKISTANNHGEIDGRMRMLENMVREVQRGVQVLRDKQEINEAQFQLKLQQQEKSDAPATKTDIQVASPSPPPPPPPPPQQQQAPQTPPPPPPPSVEAPQQHPPPQPVHPHPQSLPHIPQQQQQPPPPPPPYTYPPQAITPPQAPPPPPPPPSQQQLQSYSHQPEAPPYPQAPPHHHQPPHHPQNYPLELTSPPPPSYLPSSYGPPPPHQPPQRLPHQQQPQQQQPQHHGPSPQIYESLPGRTGSGPLALPPPAYVPAQQQQYDGGYGGGGSYRIPSSGGGGGGYPHLPTAQPVHQQQSLPSGRPSSRSGVDDVIDKVAAMGFPRDQVRGTVQRLTENGQAVDMNVVLDKLMNGGGPESGPPPKGWFGR